jgi:hypothetical protein
MPENDGPVHRSHATCKPWRSSLPTAATLTRSLPHDRREVFLGEFAAKDMPLLALGEKLPALRADVKAARGRQE